MTSEFASVTSHVISNPKKAIVMFGWLKKNPIEALEKQYSDQLIVARDFQRKGDLRQFAVETAKAEKLLNRIEQLKSEAAIR